MTGGPTRTSSTRRHTRNNNASPYSRPSGKKPSGWSLTGLLSYFNPFGSHSESELALSQGTAASRLAARGEELQSEMIELPDDTLRKDIPMHVLQDPQPQPPPSQSPPESSTGDHRTSPQSDDSHMSSMDNYKQVQEFLAGKGGQPLNHVELAGLVHILQNSVEEDDGRQEPFRFSKSPSTPARGSTPTLNFLSPSTSEQMVSAAGTAAQGARKTLAKNPMGVYRWQGGGSARPRNRYQSPSFGSTSARSTLKIVTEKPKADNKRRRVGEDATTSSPQRAGANAGGSASSTLPTSHSAPAAVNGSSSSHSASTNGRSNGSASFAPPATPRLRTNGIKPNTPAIPSPLRQTWGQSDSPPQASPTRSTSTSKPTRAASFMNQLIKDVTPPKKPDFANPYEAANPMVRPAPKKQPVRRTRASSKVETQSQKKEAGLTPQAIIEATVPKGSKRSRPPPEMVGVRPAEIRVTSPESSAPRRSTRLNGTEPKTNGVNGSRKTPSVTVEEVSDEEQPSPPKKQRTVKSPPTVVPRHPVTVEEIEEDVDMSSSRPGPPPSFTLPSEVVEPSDDKSEKRSSSPTPTPSPMFANLANARSGFPAAKSSAPKAPSKLRFSIQVDKDEKMDATPAPAPAVAPTPAIAPASASFTPAPAPIKAAEKPKDARTFVTTMHIAELPAYSFDLPLSSPGAGPSTLKARGTAKAAPTSSLPTYDLSKVAPSAPPPKPSGGFNWAAAGVKPPPKAAGDTWTCGVCMLSNPSSADKCTVCDEPRVNMPKPAVQGFNWAAAGVKPPPKPSGSQWTCSVCMLSNPSDAAKCTVCDSPR